jgi:hypothetical protein
MQDDAISDYIRAAARPDGETRRLITYILSSCWPGGMDDRSEPVARGWLRMWGPVKLIADVPTCGCEHGRCTICN